MPISISITGLSKQYQNRKVLNNIHLSIESGEIFGIIGKSGAGKSTLLRCMNLLEKPDAGDVVIEGQSLVNLSSAELRNARHRIAMIFQQFNLLETKTIEENIAIPMHIQGLPPQTIQEKVNELLDLIGLKERAADYPRQLSGGQKQRVAIARALTCSPHILLSDEATSSLDPETTESILSLLKKINLRYGITIVLITHEMDVIKQICHRVGVLLGGELKEVISLKDAFSKKESIARQLLYAQLSPKLPSCLKERLTQTPTSQPLLRLFFEGETVTGPFISQTSRALKLDINILLANIDQIDTLTCGVLIIELSVDDAGLQKFLQRCDTYKVSAEVLGYLTHAH